MKLYEVSVRLRDRPGLPTREQVTWLPTPEAAEAHVASLKHVVDYVVYVRRIPTTPRGMCSFLNHFAGV